MSQNYNTSIFENSDLWANYDQTGEIKNKLPFIFGKIPEDVTSIIDIGCGNGEITNSFPEKYSVLGVDNSKEALHYVKKDKILCSADQIPVQDQSFDMVFSSELIEHLPERLLIDSVKEFKRIAKKYIFISVPFNEQLENSYIKCPKCKEVFHAYGHLNSFTVESLSKLLGSEYKLLWADTDGKSVKNYNLTILKMRHKYAGKYFAPSKFTVCPACENRDFDKHVGNFLSKIFNGINLLIPKRPKKYWLFALFEKN